MTPKIRDGYLETPLKHRLSPNHPQFEVILGRHREAVMAGIPCYQDPVSGLSVMTGEFLASRNYCCESGCRHCPYAVDR